MDIPQPAPWKVGTKLEYLGDSISGFQNGTETVWSHKKGVVYTVIKNSPSMGFANVIDEETGETYKQIFHGWSTLQSELDPGLKHGKGIDVDTMNDYKVIRND